MRANAPVCRLAGFLLATTCFVSVGAVGAAPPAAAQTPAARVYQIPAGGLTGALNRFADASQIQLVYDASITRGLSSPGLSGSFTPSQALAQLLAGSGLDWRFANARTVTITGPAPGTADAGFTAADGAIVLDEISVSGEKVTRDLSQVYTSVGVLTDTQINDYVVHDLKDGLNKQANTRVTSANQGNSGIVVRGISSDGLTQPINQTPAIAVVLDGATQSTEGIRRGSRGTWDVEAVEVLRGPQSALQGRNAMGGAVIVKTFDPSWDWRAAVEGDFSHATGYDGYSRSGAFMLSGPIVSDQLAVRVSGQIVDGERGIDYVNALDSELDDDEFRNIRAKVLATPDSLDGFRALLSFSHTRDKPGAAAVTGPNYFDRVFDSGSGPFGVELRETEVTNYVADLSKDFGNGIVLRSVSAYIDTVADISSPAGATLYIRDDLRDGTDFTQDVRVELEDGVRALSGVVGVYYGNFDNEMKSVIRVDDSLLGGPGGTQLVYQDITRTATTESFAAYADLRYRFHDQWSVLFGGRVGHDKVGNGADGSTLFGGPVFEEASADYTVALPKLGIAYEIDERQNVAFTISEGYRAGFSGVDLAGQSYTVDPEYVWAYELAYRSRWFDNRLEFNANAFYYEFSDLQIAVPDPADPSGNLEITQNIGSAHAYGAELEVRFRPWESFTGFASIGLLKTELDEAVTIDGDFSGNEFAEAPGVTFNLGGIYRHHSGFFASADLSYTDGYFSVGNIANAPAEEVDGYTLVNAAIGFETERGSLTLYARNIFDEEYLTGISASGGSSEATVGDGRTIGVRAKATF